MAIVYIVDDNKDVANVVSMVLQTDGIDSLIFNSAESFLASNS